MRSGYWDCRHETVMRSGHETVMRSGYETVVGLEMIKTVIVITMIPGGLVRKQRSTQDGGENLAPYRYVDFLRGRDGRDGQDGLDGSPGPRWGPGREGTSEYCHTCTSGFSSYIKLAYCSSAQELQ